MKKYVLIVLFVGLITFLVNCFTNPHFGIPTPENLYKNKVDSIVFVEHKQKHGKNIGTGWYLDKNLIVTAAHVLGDTDPENRKVSIRHNDEERSIGHIISHDRQNDLALVITEKEGKPLRFCVTDPVVGEKVYSIGHIWSFRNSFSEGRIQRIGGFFNNTRMPLIQHDNYQSEGSSGAPLLSKHGCIRGVTILTFRKPNMTPFGRPYPMGSNGGGLVFSSDSRFYRDKIDELKNKGFIPYIVSDASFTNKDLLEYTGRSPLIKKFIKDVSKKKYEKHVNRFLPEDWHEGDIVKEINGVPVYDYEQYRFELAKHDGKNDIEVILSRPVYHGTSINIERKLVYKPWKEWKTCSPHC